ncbi:PREDICTED: uncharacterized protein LOC108614317 isoform X1 [Drosophila arizonae]|uniref:Uncharacterized protein LOC108614317 isoform X1 n=1 Tax=Drosophila arizonae TaxID=7263 RepID=A0ABM1P9J2_DROAR|nr:PREDICTED: uncharacterized protein LOC108614317 isoform X1 [Drosophila arizonae]
MALRVRYKWSDLTDEQLLELFESVPSDVDISSISSDNEDEEDEDLAEALNTAIEDASTVSLMPRSPLPVIEGATHTTLPSSGGFNGLSKQVITLNYNTTHYFILLDIKSIKKEPSKVIWRHQSMQLHINNVAFQGDSSLPSKLTDLKTPYQLFCYFVNTDIISMIVEETMRASFKETYCEQV